MTTTPTLTGQDIAEAEGAVTALLEATLVASGFSTTANEYAVLRAVAARGPYPTPAALHGFLAGQRQLGIDATGAATLLAGMQNKGFLTGSGLDEPGPVQLTPEGRTELGRLTQTVGPLTRPIFGGSDPEELATAHRVLTSIIERANKLRLGQEL
ncbi:MarR family winged helix-turn-helix transcriptional regulator [Nocardia tengchongensis]